MKKTIFALAVALSSPASAQGIDFRTDADSPHIYAPDGTYLGNLNNNQFDPNSISNPFGQYGSQFSPNSVNNQFGQYGSPFSPQYSNPYGFKR
ncbi:MAG: hypothetical protein AB7P97_21920 [Hyphomonadaceae bacterium]